MPWPTPVIKLSIFHNIIIIICKELKVNVHVIISVKNVVFDKSYISFEENLVMVEKGVTMTEVFIQMINANFKIAI